MLEKDQPMVINAPDDNRTNPDLQYLNGTVCMVIQPNAKQSAYGDESIIRHCDGGWAFIPNMWLKPVDDPDSESSKEKHEHKDRLLH